MPRKGVKYKGVTLTGVRIPVELKISAIKFQANMLKKGKKISLQDSYRHIARMWERGR